MKRKHLILILICDAILVAALLFWLTGCGIQRPLIKPSDIPAYEQKRQQKLQRREEDMQEFERQLELERQRDLERKQFEIPQV